jgi:hypothetical protein
LERYDLAADRDHDLAMAELVDPKKWRVNRSTSPFDCNQESLSVVNINWAEI